MSEEVLKIRNLSTSFFTTNSVMEAVKNVSFHLNKGEILGIVGESGSGKSVTCLSILRLVPSPGKIISGSIFISGHNIMDMSEKWVRKNVRGKYISMILQDPLAALNPTYTIGWQMKEALLVNQTERLNKKDLKEIMVKSLNMMDMPDPEDVLYKCPHQLSGGMRQRVVISMALLSQPSVIIADEPTTALDVTVESKVLDLVTELRNSMELSVILVSHDLYLITERCDRTIVMYGGMIMESGDSDDIFNKPKNPYTYSLLKCIPSLDEEKSNIEPIPGDAINLSNPPKGCPFHPRCFRKLKTCSIETPKLTLLDGGHEVRCFNPIDQWAIR